MPSRSCRVPGRAFLTTLGKREQLFPRYTRWLNSTHRCRMFCSRVAHIARHPQPLTSHWSCTLCLLFNHKFHFYFSHITEHREYGFEKNTNKAFGFLFFIIIISFPPPSLNGSPSERLGTIDSNGAIQGFKVPVWRGHVEL